MKLPFAFRPPHLQERWDENYQDMGGQEEKLDFCSGTFDTFQFQYPGDCDRRPEWQSFEMLICVTGCPHKPKPIQYKAIELRDKLEVPYDVHPVHTYVFPLLRMASSVQGAPDGLQ